MDYGPRNVPWVTVQMNAFRLPLLLYSRQSSADTHFMKCMLLPTSLVWSVNSWAAKSDEVESYGRIFIISASTIVLWTRLLSRCPARCPARKFLWQIPRYCLSFTGFDRTIAPIFTASDRENLSYSLFTGQGRSANQQGLEGCWIRCIRHYKVTLQYCAVCAFTTSFIDWRYADLPCPVNNEYGWS